MDANPMDPGSRPLSADELRDSQSPEFHVVAGLSTDDPHWRITTVVSVLLASAAAAGARRADGPARFVLALAAIVLLLPAISLAAMIALALLLKRLDREPAQDP
jgi:hypothetical protein